MSINSEVTWLNNSILLVTLVPSNSLSVARISRECPSCSIRLRPNKFITTSLIFLSAHNVGKDLRLRHEPSMLHHFLVVINIVGQKLVHKIFVLSSDLVLKRHSASIRTRSSHVASIRITSAQSSYSLLSVYSISTFHHHLSANACANARTCSVWEQNLVYF